MPDVRIAMKIDYEVSVVESAPWKKRDEKDMSRKSREKKTMNRRFLGNSLS